MQSGSVLATFGTAALLAAASTAFAQSATAPPLGSAASFVILGSSSVTNAGASRVTGNVGVSPGNVVTGFSSGMFSVGDVRRDDALARQARIDGNAAADDLFNQPCSVVLTEPTLGGRTLVGGNVYCFNAPDVQLTGPLILDAAGDRNAVWIFHINGTLITTPDASVIVVGNGYNGNAFWWTGGAAMLGARTTFIGNLFAGTNIALGDGASISGRAFARTGSVMLHANKVSLCCAPLTLTPDTLPPGEVGTVYGQSVTASGGTAPYTFTISSGSLPFGLALAANGTLQGTPARKGTFAFTVTATDAIGCSSSAAYSIGIDCGARTALPPATVGVDYAAPLTFDGIPPFTDCSISCGMLPSQLHLAGCTVMGKPDTAGTFDFVVDGTDALGARRSRCLTIDVVECPIVLLPPDPPDGVACAFYTYTFQATGGTAPYVFTAPPAALPPGWSLYATTGMLSGTTPRMGTYIIPVTVTDALLRSCVRTVTIHVSCPPSPGAPVILPPGIVGTQYSETIPQPACGGPATISVVSGVVPPGLTVIRNGVVSGIPTKRGTYHFVVGARTADMCTTTHDVKIDIDCPELLLSPLPPMVQGVFYDQTITVTGLLGRYLFTADSLPVDLKLDGSRIHGTPMKPGPYSFTITATDMISGCIGNRTYNPNCPTLVVKPAALPNGTVGVVYPTITFSVTGGMAPYVFTVSSGSLPSGLNLSTGGTLFGTPTTIGTFAFDIRVTDAFGCVTILSFCGIDVAAASCPSGTSITLSPSALPAATPGSPYAQAITAAGGTAPYTFSVSSGALPPGLVLNPVTGLLSGLPAAVGSFAFTITATDANGCRGSRCYILRVGVAIPTISPWMLFVASILLAAAGWIAIGRR